MKHLASFPWRRSDTLNFGIKIVDKSNLGFWGEGKAEFPEIISRCRVENQKLNPHLTPALGIDPGPHWWEASALTTAPSLHPKITKCPPNANPKQNQYMKSLGSREHLAMSYKIATNLITYIYWTCMAGWYGSNCQCNKITKLGLRFQVWALRRRE